MAVRWSSVRLVNSSVCDAEELISHPDTKVILYRDLKGEITFKTTSAPFFCFCLGSCEHRRQFFKLLALLFRYYQFLFQLQTSGETPFYNTSVHRLIDLYIVLLMP